MNGTGDRGTRRTETGEGAARLGRPLQPSPPHAVNELGTDLDVGEDVGLTDPRDGDLAVTAVGPRGVDDVVVGRQPAVVADERTRCEEPVVGVPRRGADATVRPRCAVVPRHRLEGSDVVVVRILTSVEPHRDESTALIGCDPREELVVPCWVAVAEAD